jgi:hypothetical protein
MRRSDLDCYTRGGIFIGMNSWGSSKSSEKNISSERHLCHSGFKRDWEDAATLYLCEGSIKDEMNCSLTYREQKKNKA